MLLIVRFFRDCYKCFNYEHELLISIVVMFEQWEFIEANLYTNKNSGAQLRLLILFNSYCSICVRIFFNKHFLSQSSVFGVVSALYGTHRFHSC